jgi:RecJ-like exonuclease
MGYYKNLEIEQQDKEIASEYQKRKEARRKAFNANYGKKMVECPACSGSGHYDHNGSPACAACSGTGKVKEN